MDIFSRGKFEACLESVDEQLKKQHISVSMELMLHSDALVCQYMLEQKDRKNLLEEFKMLLMKSSSLSPTEEVNRLELTVLHNYIYYELLNSISQPGTQDLTPLYTHAARVFYRVYSILQPLSYLDIRKDLPTDVKACSSILLHHCINSLPFGTDHPLLAPACHVVCLLAIIEMKRDKWGPAIDLLSSLHKVMVNSYRPNSRSSETGFLLPLCLEHSADILTSCPVDWLNFLLGIAHFQLKLWSQARNILQKVQTDCFLPYVSYLTGLCSLNEDMLSEAVTAVGNVIRTCRTVPIRLKAKMYNLLGDCFGRLEKPQLSIQMYKEGLAVDFGYLLPLYNISLQYQKLGTIDVELECLNLLVTSLESNMASDVSLEVDGRPEHRFISVLELITTHDNNISYPHALYRLASSCLQVERYEISCQKYQDLIAYLTDSSNTTKAQKYGTGDLPSLRQIHHEAILSMLKAGKYSDCLHLCDKVIACYHGGGKGHNFNIGSSSDNTQMSVDLNSEIRHDNEIILELDNSNNNNLCNLTDNDHGLIDRMDDDNTKVKRTLKRKRHGSDIETRISEKRNTETEVEDQTLSCDNIDIKYIEFDHLNCDVLALKYKAEVLEKLGENTAAVECLERAVSSISEHRKANLQRSLTASTNISADQPVAKRPKISSHCDRGQESEESDQQVVLPATDILSKFEADLYQSLGKILNSQGQHSDALHYFRLAAQLQPATTENHYLCTETLLLMKCPKVACNNWLRHRKLSHITTVQQLDAEIARKQQSVRSDSNPEESKERVYVEMDIKCLQIQQQH